MFQAAVVKRLQKCHTADHIWRVSTRYRQCHAGLRTQCDKHGIELLAQVTERNIFTDTGICANLDAKVKDALNLTIENFIRNPVTGNTVTHHSAQLFLSLKHRAGMSHTPQMIGTGKTGNTAADDRYFFTGVSTWLVQLQPVFQTVIADKLFNCIDTDMIFDLVAVAAVFAGCRTDPAHDGGEWIGIGNAVEGIFLPGFIGRRLFNTTHNVQPATDILTRGATALAGRGTVNIGRTFV